MWYILLTPRFIYKKEDFNTTRNENTYSEIVRMKKTSGKKGDVCKAENGSKQLSYWCSGIFIFLKCSSALNAAPCKKHIFKLYLVYVFFLVNVLGKHEDLSSIIFDIQFQCE